MHNYARMKLARLILSIALFLAATLVTTAEDWKTTDGKTYEQVQVVKIEDDAVTILDKDGGALVPLSTLPPNLQTQFHYDPAKAQIAAAKRQQEEQAAIAAAVPSKPAEQPPAQLIAQAQPAASPTPTPPPPVPATTPSPAPSSQFALNPGQQGAAADATHQTPNPNWKLVLSLIHI